MQVAITSKLDNGDPTPLVFAETSNPAVLRSALSAILEETRHAEQTASTCEAREGLRFKRTLLERALAASQQ
jgi:hypothetical protein